MQRDLVIILYNSIYNQYKIVKSVQNNDKEIALLFNPFVTSGTYISHLQRVFSSQLG